MPTRGRHHHRPRIVLEEPARSSAVSNPTWMRGGLLPALPSGGATRGKGGPRVCGRRRGSSPSPSHNDEPRPEAGAGRRRALHAKHSPLSSAWPMPSPVIGSVARAASPTKSTRPPPAVSAVLSTRAGIGQALWAASGLRVCRAGLEMRTRQQVRPQRLHRPRRLTRRAGCRSPRWRAHHAAGTTRSSPAADQVRTRPTTHARPDP